jgi:hypothetical protein
MEKSKLKNAEALEESKPAPERIHVVRGYTWIEYMSVLSGFYLFKYKEKEVFKFELFWSGINPYDVLDCKKGFHCQEITERNH